MIIRTADINAKNIIIVRIDSKEFPDLLFGQNTNIIIELIINSPIKIEENITIFFDCLVKDINLIPPLI